ncbi:MULTISPECIES: VanZ family protein [unclassified Bacillus (in: firmicutes)]|uniref:VanZ family protein n=1 Tax=unclassified Bacillus (in: firmicutes) TaxID=185979 RepID=UPI0008E0B711|nr:MULTISPECIES: VanZ family protein [unclassified Bacillus (in: firmicutes)]SFJ38068.1 VanZ like family protein [Bacillus sp. 71mf]SFS52206.1 VanZ like family protein [Bacillus sp. 103mf]
MPKGVIAYSLTECPPILGEYICERFIKIVFFIKLLQLLTFTGIFDVDDIILNTSGALIGYSIYIGMKKLWIRYKRTNKTISF